MLVRSWFRERQDGSPFGPAIEEQGRHGSLEYTSDTMQAPPEIRERLGLAEADGHWHDVMRTAYLFSTKDEGPWMLLTSWEPLALTKGTPIAFPEGGEFAGQGVPRRMASIGLMVDAWDERVSARVATHKEAKRLDIGAGSVVMVIQRAHLAGDRVVEVADIVVPAESTMLAYNGPVGDAAATS